MSETASLRWMTLSAAYAHVLSVLHSPHSARAALKEGLKADRIRSQAGSLKTVTTQTGASTLGTDMWLPASFWSSAQTAFDRSDSAEELLYMATGEIVRGRDVARKRASTRHASDIKVLAKDVAREWPNDRSTTFFVEPEPELRRKHVAGRKAGFDWEKCIIEAAGYLNENDNTVTQAKLVDYILDWFGNDAPSATSVKDHLSPLIQRFRRE